LVFETALPEFSDGPGDIERGPDGNLWLIAARASSIVRLTPQGEATYFSIPGLDQPTTLVAIAVGPDGNLWFTDSSQPPRIGRINTAGEVTMFPAPDPPQGSFFPVTPTDITTGPDGHLYFTDYQGTRIGRVATDGTMTLIPIVPEDLDISVLPAGITTGPDGNLWFADRGNGAIFRMTPAGAFTPFRTDADTSATAITTGPDGALWFTASNIIGRITTAGVVTDEFVVPGAFANMTGITTGPDGALWVTSQTTNKLLRVETSGEMKEFPLDAGAQPVAIVTGPDDALWFTEPGVNKIGRLDPAEAAPPEPPAGDWLAAAELPGFRAKVRITAGSTSFAGKKVEDCIEDTLCVSGALASQPEIFVRVVGPKPNGKLWPTLVKFSTSQAEVWIEQLATGVIRYYKLLAVDPGATILNLAGVADKNGFEDEESVVVPFAAGAAARGRAEATGPAPPAGEWLTSEELGGFRAKVRVTASEVIEGAKVENCIVNTLCVSGALKGRPEVFVRVVGPKPNGKLWPTLVKFSTSRIEVWVEQEATAAVQYYLLEAVAPGAEILDLAGLADKEGFTP
jgi:virginiamycin B lyase